ncbi:hypothetical protein [Okeania sp. SIO1I7]|nr:hypothetical protein [Okeania sp. SIO1I7]
MRNFDNIIENKEEVRRKKEEGRKGIFRQKHYMYHSAIVFIYYI